MDTLSHKPLSSLKPEHFCPDYDWDLYWQEDQTLCMCVFHPTYVPIVYEDCWCGSFELGEND